MPVLQLCSEGLTMGNPPGRNVHVRALRDVCQGWSKSSTRSNTRFLYSVDQPKLGRFGLALSLTVRDCPPTSAEWTRLRRAFFERLRRLGMVRAHWLTEWQRRGVPHLHSAVWFESGDRPGGFIIEDVLNGWLAVASAHGAMLRGQHIEPITDSLGWLKYLAKHGSRGLGHYQRSPENVPVSWHEKTGRMWGKLGEWPMGPVLKISLDQAGGFAFRRIVQRWRFADARASGDRHRIRSARMMLRAADRKQSAVRGVSEWINQDTGLDILAHLAGCGFKVTS